MRTVGVSLEAETGPYQRDVTGAARTTRALKGDVDALGVTAERTGRKVDDLGGDFRDTARDAQALQREISETKRSLAGLAVEFAAAGSVADRLDISKSMRRQQGELRQLLRVEKLLPTPAEVQPAARSLGRGVLAGMATSIEGAGPVLVPALAGTVVAVAPLIGATVSGAILGAAGLGGVIGGLALARKDPRVQAAIDGLGDRLQDRLTRSTSVFVQPALDGIARIDQALQRVDIESALRNTAQHVKPLMDGVGVAVENIGDGLVRLARNSGPALDAIGDGVAMFGKTVGDGLRMLAEHGPEAADALRTLFGIVNGAVKTVFQLVDALTELYRINKAIGGDVLLQQFLKITGNQMDDTATKGRRLGSGTWEAAKGIDGAADAARGAQAPQKALSTTLSNGARSALGQRDALTALSRELRAEADPAFALIDAQRTLKVAQDRAAEAVRQHGRRSQEARQATRDLALAALDLQGKTGQLSTTFTGRLSPAMRATLESAGLTKRQINDVEREFKEARTAAQKYAQNWRANTQLTGETRVELELRRLSSMQQALKSGRTIARLGGAAGMAGGGPVAGYSPSDTADNIPAMLTADEWVIQRPAARRLEQSNPGALKYINETGRLPAYGRGGRVRRYAGGGQVWPFDVNVGGAWAPSEQQAMAAVMPSGGPTDAWILATVHGRFPGLHAISVFRPGSRTLSGNASYHGMHRAVDWPPSRALAEWWNANYKARTKELITPWQSLNIHNGQRHAYSEAIYRQHSGSNAHDHIAMAGGGLITEPVFGVGASGRTYSFAERGIETVTPGVATGGGAGAGTVVNLNVALAAGANPREAGRQIAQVLQTYLAGGGSVIVGGRTVLSAAST